MKYIHPSAPFRKLCAKTGWLGIALWHRFAYYRLRGNWPNFKHPQDLSEHLLSAMNHKSWLKYSKYADKVKVRDYIKSKGLDEILLKTYGAWHNAKDIDFSKLPDKFALKPNNGSGGHYFCKDKSKIDIPLVVEQLNNALHFVDNDISFAFERHYKNIEPQIYCEELIDTGGNSWPIDYKFTCIKGRIIDIFVAVERETGKTKYCTLDTNWNILPYTKDEYLPKTVPEKPKHLDRMIEIAKILSKDFECVRVDLYEYHDKVYFSELTFSPWGGYMYSYTDEAIKIIGKEFDN